MYFPIRRRGAAIAGVMSLAAIVCSPPRHVLAGPVMPDVEPAVAIQPESVDAARLSSPFAGIDAQQFWYPGSKEGFSADTISLSSTPVQTTDITGASTLAGAQQHPLIPLPGAAWTGLAGLLGLGVVKVGRNFRRLLA